MYVRKVESMVAKKLGEVNVREKPKATEAEGKVVTKSTTSAYKDAKLQG